MNTDVEDTCVDVSKEGHDDVNTYVRIHNIRLQYGSLLSQLEEFSGVGRKAELSWRGGSNYRDHGDLGFLRAWFRAHMR